MNQLALVDPTVQVRGLTLWNPMAWAIAEFTKRIENRPWRPWKNITHVAIHAGSKYYQPHAEQIEDIFDIDVPGRKEIVSGAVLCVARIAGCIGTGESVHDSEDPWFSGPGTPEDPNYGWLLEDVVKLPSPLPCKGMMGLWHLPSNIESIVLRHIRGEQHGDQD